MFLNFIVASSLFGAIAAAAAAGAKSNVPEAMITKKIASNNAKKMRFSSSAPLSTGRNNKGSSAAAIKMTEEATSWVQYSLYSEGSDCTGDAHYLYWQASNTCIAAEWISGYNEYQVDNYVKVSCTQSGNEIILSNQYFSDSNCTDTTQTLNASVNAACSEQQTGAFNANTNPYIALDDDSLAFDEYGTLVGNKMATACLAAVSEPWTQIDNPHGLADVLYDDDDCGGFPAQADLFVYDVCSKQNQTARASSQGNYVKLTSCDESSLKATFSYYDQANCSGTAVNTQDVTVLGENYCMINLWAQNSVGEANDDHNFCLTPAPTTAPSRVPTAAPSRDPTEVPIDDDDDRDAAAVGVDVANSAAFAVVLASTLAVFCYHA